MTQPLRISILGCGWLGLPLAVRLVQEGCVVKGSTTSTSKLSLLKDHNILPYLIKVSQNDLSISDMDFFNCDILYINIPPRRRVENIKHRYPKEINQVLEHAKDYNIEKVIFISSTGVYADDHKEKTESDNPIPIKASGRALLSAEQNIKESKSFSNWVILRMSGLAGPNREPGRWFSGKRDIPNGLNPVNMVHLEDCIGISLEIVKRSDVSNTVLNVCADEHPAKIDFYSNQCLKLNIPLPHFKKELGPHKVVSNRKVKEILGYSFIYSDPQRF